MTSEDQIGTDQTQRDRSSLNLIYAASTSTLDFLPGESKRTTAAIARSTLPSVNFTSFAYAKEIGIEVYKDLSEEELPEYLKQIDPIKLFRKLEATKTEIALLKTEIHYMIDFFHENSPKSMPFIEEKRLELQKRQQSTFSTAFTINQHTDDMSNATYSMRASNFTRSDAKLNFATRNLLLEKSISKVEQHIKKIKWEAHRKFRLLIARIEELGILNNETIELTKNFKLNFCTNQSDIEFLTHAPENRLRGKMLQFINSWISDAHSMLGLMHFRKTALDNLINKKADEVDKQSDLKGIVNWIEVKYLECTKSDLHSLYKEKLAQLNSLKTIGTIVSIAMVDTQAVSNRLFDDLCLKNQRITEISKTIKKLTKKAIYLKNENKNSKREIKSLKEKQGKFSAPSINVYISAINELRQLVKDEKILKRHVSIHEMMLNGLKTKMRQIN